MKIAITGASGHVGNNLCRKLLEKGYSIRGLLYHDNKSLEGLDIETVKGDILNPESLNGLFEGIDVAIHLAAIISIEKNESELFRVNVDGTRNVAEACKKAGVRKLIHFSTIHAIEHLPLDEVLDENRPLIKHSKIKYEQSKAEGDRMVQELCGNHTEYIIFNPTAILGPNDFKPSLMGQVLIKLARNQMPMLVPGGYDWVDVRDISDAVAKAIELDISGERYLLSGGWKSLKELSLAVGKVTGNKTPTMIAPMTIAKIGLPFIQAWARMRKEHPLYTKDSLDVIQMSSKNVSHTKAERDLGFTARPLEETVRDTLGWFEEQGYL
jgi:dihydroflavonol-4-reductase